MEQLEKIREYFSHDLFATQAAGIVIDEAGVNHAVCSMEIKPVHLNAQGGVMGGAIFTLADFTFAIASNVEQAPTVSLTSQITYLGVCKGKKLIASAHCRKSGRSTCYFVISVEDELENPVAEVTITGFRKSK